MHKRASIIPAALLGLASIALLLGGVALGFATGQSAPRPADPDVIKVLKMDGCYYYAHEDRVECLANPVVADAPVRVLKDDGCYYYSPLIVQCPNGGEPAHVGEDL